MSTKAQEILNKFENQLQYICGPLDKTVLGPASWENPKDQCVIYALNDKALQSALQSSCSLIICDQKISDSLPTESSICIFTSPTLQLMMAQINQYFFPVPFAERTFDGEHIHSSAVISQSAQLGENVVVGPHACIESSVVIGDNCFIGAGTYVGKGTTIGAGTSLEANVYIGRDCQIGQQCRVQALTAIGSDGYGYATNTRGQHEFKPHYGKVILEDRVEVGANVSIDRGAYDDSIIGEGTKIDNHCHFGHNIKMGKHCFVTAGFISAGSCNVGDHCAFGGRSSLGGHLSITGQTTIAGMGVVTKDITEPGAYGGFPAIPLKDSLRALKSVVHLPELRKTVQKILTKVNIDE